MVCDQGRTRRYNVFWCVEARVCNSTGGWFPFYCPHYFHFYYLFQRHLLFIVIYLQHFPFRMDNNESDTDFDLTEFQSSGLSQNSTSTIQKEDTDVIDSHDCQQQQHKQHEGEPNDSSTFERAKQKISHLIIPKEINHTSKLLWHVIPHKKKIQVYPCRLCHKDEAIGLALSQTWDENKKILVEYICYRRKKLERSLVHKTQIKPYGKDGIFHAPYLQLYLSTFKKNKEIEELALQQFLTVAMEREKSQSQQTNNQNNNDQDFDPIGLDSQLLEPECSIPSTLIMAAQHSETLKAGDEIEYTTPIFVCGDARGYRKTIVMEIRPRHHPILKLQNAEILMNSTMIRRIRVMTKGTLVEYPNGSLMPIDSYKLKADKVSGADTVVHDRLVREQKAVGQLIAKLESNIATATQDAGYGELGTGFLAGTKRKRPASSPGVMRKSRTTSSMELENNELTTSIGTTQKVNVINDDLKEIEVPSWKVPLLEQIDTLRKNKMKRRSAPPHMPEEQLELAIAVMERLQEQEKSIDALGDEIDADIPVLNYFLTGDVHARVRAKNHTLTQQSLEAWLRTHDEGHSEDDKNVTKRENTRDSPVKMYANDVTQEPDWKTKLLELSERFRQAKGRRRSAPPHMTEENLEIAIKVREQMDISGIDIQNLAESLKISDRNLEYFLKGDEFKQVFARQHVVTHTVLENWLRKEMNFEVEKVVNVVHVLTPDDDPKVSSKGEKCLNPTDLADVNQQVEECDDKKIKRDEIAELASEAYEGEVNSDLTLESSDSSHESAVPIEECVDWESQLTGLLEKSKTEKTHMPRSQLEMALRVRRRITEIDMSISALSEVLDLPFIGLTRFLEGDPDKVMGEASHEDTEKSLEKWLETDCANLDSARHVP